MERDSSAVVIMACSATKQAHAAPALDLYQGVMYSTFRANVKRDARPHVVILSAQHGFIPGDEVIAPYEQRLTPERANEMLAKLDAFIHGQIPSGSRKVLLAGGQEYRRVMRAAVQRQLERGRLATSVKVSETSGGIGYQRQQLGAFLRGLLPGPEIVGHHQNGTPLYRTLGAFSVDQRVNVVYRGREDLAPAPAIITELFHGQVGPTANVRLLESKQPDKAFTWVGLGDLHAIPGSRGVIARADTMSE
jgi:hypothetical protein